MCSVPGFPPPASELHVLVSRVTLNPGYGLVEFWVNMNDGGKHIYEQMTEETQMPKKFCGPEGKAGDECLVCISNTWHRARIVSMENQTYEVFLLDRAQLRHVTSDVLAWGPGESVHLTAQSQSCILANVVSVEEKWPEEATRFLNSLPGNKFKGQVQHLLIPGRTIVLDIPVVSKHLCQMGVAQEMPADEFKCLVVKCLNTPSGVELETCSTTHKHILNVSHSQYFYPELSTHNTLETVKVTAVTNPRNIFCQLVIFSKALKMFLNQLTLYYEGSSDLEEAQPQTCGAPCAAKGTDGHWHRSRLKQNFEATTDGHVEVFYVDKGRTEFVPVGNIRALHDRFLRMPVVTYHCLLDGLEDDDTGWTEEQTDVMKSLLQDQTVVARFHHHDLPQDAYHVSLYTANAACIKQCFLKKAVPIDQNEPVSASFSTSDKESIMTQDKVHVEVDGLEGEPQRRANNLHMNGERNYAALQDTTSEKSNGYVSTHSPTDVTDGVVDDDMLTVGSSVSVKVSCIESLQKFWCQAAENDDRLRVLMQNLQTHYASSPPAPLVESICIARNPDNGMWYRVKIIANHHTPEVHVRFIDYGLTRKVCLRDVHPIDPTYMRLNAQAFQCCLFSHATTGTKNALAEFQKFVDSDLSPNRELKCIIKAVASDEEGLSLNVVDLQTPSESFFELLAQKCAPAEADEEDLPQVPSDEYSCCTHSVKLGDEEQVLVTFSESVNHFYCQLQSNSHLADKVNESVKQLLAEPLCTDRPISLNSICLAKYTSDQWYRGQVTEVSPELKVHFVDYGDTLTVDESNIRPIPSGASSARTVPVLAIPLGLAGIPEDVPQEVNQWFADKAVGESLTISVIEKGAKGKLTVELFQGPLNVNSSVRAMIEKVKGQDLTGVRRNPTQQRPPSSQQAGEHDEDVFTQEHMNGSPSKWCHTQKSTEFSICSRDGPKPNTPSKTHAIVPGEGVNGVNGDVVLQTAPPCFPERNLNSHVYKKTNLSRNQPEEVYVSSIVSPHYFWCQYSTTETLNRISRLALEVAEAQQDLKDLDTLGPGSPCLALFPDDNQWYRAQVIQRTEDTLNVLFIDYGNETEVNLKGVRSLPSSLLEDAPQAFLCSLEGFEEPTGSWDDAVYDEFYNLLVDKPLKVKVLNMGNHPETDLPQYTVQIDCNDVVVHKVMQKYWRPDDKGHAMAKSPNVDHVPQSDTKKMHPSSAEAKTNVCMYKKPKVVKNQRVDVYASCVGAAHYFWCQYSNADELGKVTRLAQAAGQADVMVPDTLGPGTPCLALFSDNQWYRAQVIRRNGDTLSVVFVDYGNESDVNIKDVRSLPSSLLDEAPRAFLCSLDGFDDSTGSWDDAAHDRFCSLITDKLLKVTPLNMENQSEISLPKYTVQIDCDGVAVHEVMQKHWKSAAGEPAVTGSCQTESLHQSGQRPSNQSHLNSTKVNVWKENVFKNETEVYASCIDGPQYFWCQYADAEVLRKVSSVAQAAGRTDPDATFPGTLGPGSACLTLFSDNNWYRAQVIRRTGDTLHVVFIDYGNESDVNVNDVRPLPHSLLEEAPQAFLCSLDGFEESRGSWDDAVYDDFYTLLIDKQLRMMVLNIKQHAEIAVPQYVVLIKCDNTVVNSDVRKYWKPLLATDSHQTNDVISGCDSPSDATPLVLSEGRTYKKPNISKNHTANVYASCIGDPHYFWCQFANAEELHHVIKLAQEAGEEESWKVSEALDPGSPCLALFASDRQWYRAQVVNRTGDALHVVFIDYGNEAEVDVKDVRSVPQSLLERPPQAFLCSLNGFDTARGSWDDNIYDEFYNLLDNKLLRIKVVHVENESEFAIPQYNVQISCNGQFVNKLMEKFWRTLDTDGSETRAMDESSAGL